MGTPNERNGHQIIAQTTMRPTSRWLGSNQSDVKVKVNIREPNGANAP